MPRSGKFVNGTLNRDTRIPKTDGSAAGERAHEPAAQLVGDSGLIERQRLELDAERRHAVSQRLDADDLQGLEQDPRPTPGRAASNAPDLACRPHDAIEVLAVGDLQVHDGEREDLAQIRQAGDGAVREHLHRAFAVADDDRAEVDLLDRAGDVVDPRQIADPHLILENQKETGDDVAHEILRAEADRQARDAGAGQDRQDVERQLAQQHQDGDEADRRRDQARQDAAQRRRAPLPLEIGGACRRDSLNCRCSISEVRDADHGERARQDHDDVDAVGDEPRPSARGSQAGSSMPNRLSARDTLASAAMP